MRSRCRYFGVRTKAVRQCRGSPIRSPLSPALCGTVIASLESVWTRTFRVSGVRFHACFLRYVDNRLLFAPQSILKLPWVQLLLSKESNGQAMILEDEQKHDFLVFQIDFRQGFIKFNRAIQDSDLLDPLSAAPKTTLLSGLLSRAFLIKKCGYPSSQMCNFYGSLLKMRGLPVHEAKFKRWFFGIENLDPWPVVLLVQADCFQITAKPADGFCSIFFKVLVDAWH